MALSALAGSIGQPRRTRRIGTAAAALAAVLLIAVIVPRESSRSSSEQRLRETASMSTRAIVAVSPTDSATVPSDSVRFVWHRESVDAGYRLVVNDDAGNVAWTIDTPDTAAALPDSIRLTRDRIYFWYVDAIGREGSTRATGLRRFRIAP